MEACGEVEARILGSGIDTKCFLTCICETFCVFLQGVEKLVKSFCFV